MPSREETLRLFDDGVAAVNERRYAEALWIARELKRRRFSGAFEIAARAFLAIKKPHRARTWLETGVNHAPQAPALWNWYGTILSDAGEYDAAFSAFGRAMKLDESRREIELANLAVVEERRGRFVEALALLDQIDASQCIEPSDVEFAEFRARLHIANGDYDEADRILQQSVLEPAFVENNDALRARLLICRARVAQARSEDAKALALAREAVARDAMNANAHGLLRQMTQSTKLECRAWRLLVVGTSDRVPDTDGYFVSFDVAAVTEQEALAFIRVIESAAGYQVDQIKESTDLGAILDFPGVLARAGPRQFFSEDD